MNTKYLKNFFNVCLSTAFILSSANVWAQDSQDIQASADSRIEQANSARCIKKITPVRCRGTTIPKYSNIGNGDIAARCELDIIDQNGVIIGRIEHTAEANAEPNNILGTVVYLPTLLLTGGMSKQWIFQNAIVNLIEQQKEKVLRNLAYYIDEINNPANSANISVCQDVEDMSSQYEKPAVRVSAD